MVLGQEQSVFGPQPTFTADFIMLLKIGHAVTAFFAFDESIRNVDLNSIPGGLINYVRHVLITTGGPNRTTNYDGPEKAVVVAMERKLKQVMKSRMLNKKK